MKLALQHSNTHQPRLLSRWGLLHRRLMWKSPIELIPLGCACARLLNHRVMLTRTWCQTLQVKMRQVVQNMHAIVHGLKLRLALMKALVGRISQSIDFIAYRFGVLGLTGLV